MSQTNDQGDSQATAYDKGKVLYIIKITSNLDPNLKHYLNSLKTALLKRTISMRLVIIEGEKIIAG